MKLTTAFFVSFIAALFGVTHVTTAPDSTPPTHSTSTHLTTHSTTPAHTHVEDNKLHQLKIIEFFIRAVLVEGHKGTNLKQRLHYVAQGLHSLPPNPASTVKEFTCPFSMEETHKTIPQACIAEIRDIAILYNFKRIDGVVELLRDRMFLIFVSDAPAEQRIEKLVEAYLDLTTRNVIDLKAHGRPACIAKGIAQIHHKPTPAGETEEHKIQEMAIEFHHAMGDLQKATTDHTLPVAC